MACGFRVMTAARGRRDTACNGHCCSEGSTQENGGTEIGREGVRIENGLMRFVWWRGLPNKSGEDFWR